LIGLSSGFDRMSKARWWVWRAGPLLALLVGQAEARAAAAPAIVNASFDDDGTGVASPSGWTSVGSTDADYTEPGGYSGGYRLTHWSPVAYSVETTQTITGLDSGWVSLTGWVRKSTGANDSYVALVCGDSRDRVDVPIALPDQWLHVVVSVRPRKGACTIVLHTDAAAGEWANFDAFALAPVTERSRPSLSVLGADVSSLHKSEDLGGVYFDDGADGVSHDPRDRHQEPRARSALKILKDHGADHVRLRVWVNPADGYHDIAEAIEMSKRAHEAGLAVLVDLHYSDTWADPGHQAKPAAWASYSVPELAQAVYDHTYAVCSGIKKESRAPEMIQLGNEIDAGMLFPDGSTYDPPNWANLAAFLEAGYAAVKACSSETKVMLHLSNGGDNGLFEWWLDNITALGVPFDVIGASYYGYWDGSLGDLQANLDDVSARYGKDVVVAETAYPFTLDDADGWPDTIGLASQLVAGYAATPEGQASSFRDVMSIVRAVPNGHGLGAFYWDATWTSVPGNGWDPTDPSSGNAWENQALLDFDDVALPAMSQFRR
jgi:arabinogalactan endo-1,4-beta-galactosidase